ncbi:M48 family metallopeptidase [Paractinoplanes toevensis]|uniref:M48 family metallopeptidase n=1 Tax=Paractinoplanes toevensis TaxID=571911 RepID=UPI001BB36B8F|nr:M56 family metallopeptidase [Actinoplanes toevensis]
MAGAPPPDRQSTEVPSSGAAEILAVPSGTTLRFGTVVTLAVASTVFVYTEIGAIWPGSTSYGDERCQVRAGLYLTSDGITDPNESKWAAYRGCMSGVFLPRLGWLVSGLLLLAAVATIIYYVQPIWRVRRSRLLRLDEVPTLEARLRGPLADLVATAGLRRAPTFLLDASSTRAGGFAFGRRRRPLVCLDAGLVALLDQDRRAFDAVVLHELAHARNNDVTTTYATLSVWRSFLLVAAAPYAMVYVLPVSGWPLRWTEMSPTQEGAVIRLVAMGALVYLARTAVLRSRERYADAMVVLWTGHTDPYSSLAHRKRLRVPSWIATHPSRSARAAAMREPRQLLRPGVAESVLAGAAVQLAWSNLGYGLAKIAWYREGNHSQTIMRVVLAFMIGVVVCLIARRGAAYRRAGGGRPLVFVLPGCALGFGLVLSMLMTLQESGLTAAQSIAPARVVLGVTVVVAGATVCGWAGYCARLIGPQVLGRRGLLTAAAVVLVCFSGLSWFADSTAAEQVWRELLHPAFEFLATYAREAQWSPADRPILSVVVGVFVLNTHRVVTAMALAVVWLVPLLLAPDAGRRLRCGLLAGAAGAAGWAMTVAGLRVAATGHDGAAFALVLTAWEIAAAGVVQFVVACLVVRRADGITAAIAVWILSVCAGAGVWITHWQHGHVDSALATRPLQVLPILGTAMTLVALTVRRSPRATPAATDTTRSPRVVAPVVAGLLAVSAAGVVWWPHAPTVVPLLPPAQAGSYDLNQAVTIWIYGGGWDTAQTVDIARDKAVRAFGTADTSAIEAACKQLQTVVGDAAGFPLPPAPEVRDTWTAEIDDTAIAASECVRAMRSGIGSDLMVAKFESSIAHAGRLIEQLDQALRHTSRIGPD